MNSRNDYDVLDFLKDTFGITDIPPKSHAVPSNDNDAFCNKIIDCLYDWQETGDKTYLTKANFYLTRLMRDNP